MKTHYWNRKHMHRSGFALAVILIGLPAITIAIVAIVGAVQ